MGYGSFNTSASAARTAFRASTGSSAFTHDAAAKAGKVPKLHPSLDLRRKPRRECRDNADNPTTLPIAVFVDVTGSMGGVAKQVIDSLYKMVGAVKAKGAIPYPSLLFGAIGDAYSDQVPIQVGEFEASDELAEAHLSNIFIEGNGGGQNRESYELAIWFAANQVDTDAWDKRGDKGFLFITGDEAPYPRVNASQVSAFAGFPASEDVSLSDIVRKAEERWHVFVLRPGGTSNYADPSIRQAWEQVLSAERVIDVPNWNDIVPVIAGTVSVMSGISLADTLAAMRDSGLDTSGSSTALATVADSALAVSGTTDLAESDAGGSIRL